MLEEVKSEIKSILSNAGYDVPVEIIINKYSDEQISMELKFGPIAGEQGIITVSNKSEIRCLINLIYEFGLYMEYYF